MGSKDAKQPDPIRLFKIGARGVNVVVGELKLTQEELRSGQNVEFVTEKGEGALDQRPGMSKINSATMTSAIRLVHDVPQTFLAERTPYLYAAITAGSFTWRRSTDGSTWTNQTPSVGSQYACAGFTYAGPFKAWPKAISLGRKFYFIGQVNTGGVDPLPLKSLDGTTEELVAYIPPGMTGTVLGTPNAPVIGQQGVTGATTYTYKLVARFAGSNSAASAGGSNTQGNAVLSSSNYNIIQANGLPVAGATSYDVYRTVGGATQGKVGSIPIVAGAFTTGNGSGLGSSWTFTDGGLVGDASVAPVAASGAQSANALAVLDMCTDGTRIYMAVYDANGTDPVLYGRILEFNPATATFRQLGTTFPRASGNGCPGALAFFDGALSFATYIGTAAANTAWLNSCFEPLPAGGIYDVKTTAASLPAISLCVFNGELYAGTASLVAGTAAVVMKRAAGAVWTTALTAPATAVRNAFTSLWTYNGRLYAGWNSGSGGATAANIKSTADGATWTTEITLAAQEMPCQSAIFNNELYVALGYGPDSSASRVIKRTAAGVWSTADDPSDNLSGALCVVYT